MQVMLRLGYAHPGEQHGDGDALNGMFIKEMDMVNILMNLHPMMTMYSTDRPGIGTMVDISAQSYMILQNWLSAN